jgi:hypothetical protein
MATTNDTKTFDLRRAAAQVIDLYRDRTDDNWNALAGESDAGYKALPELERALGALETALNHTDDGSEVRRKASPVEATRLVDEINTKLRAAWSVAHLISMDNDLDDGGRVSRSRRHRGGAGPGVEAPRDVYRRWRGDPGSSHRRRPHAAARRPHAVRRGGVLAVPSSGGCRVTRLGSALRPRFGGFSFLGRPFTHRSASAVSVRSFRSDESGKSPPWAMWRFFS